MNSPRVRPPVKFPRVPGFDLRAGPEGLEDPQRVRAARRLGSLRKRQSEQLLPQYLRQEQLDGDFLNILGWLCGPAARSGEDLPPLKPQQYELAGFCYTRTVHCECWSLRASCGLHRIYYHIDDETDPGAESGTRPALLTTTAWPSLGKLIWIIDHSVMYGQSQGMYFSSLVWEYADYGSDPHSLIGDIRVYSAFYPALSDWYQQATQRWAARLAADGQHQWLVDSITLMSQEEHT